MTNIPRIQANFIGEKLIIECRYHFANWPQLHIRRLPMDCSDYGEEMREKDREDHENLPFIHLWGST